MIRAVASDVDDTLFPYDKTLSDRVITTTKNAMIDAGLDPSLLHEIGKFYANLSFVEVLGKLQPKISPQKRDQVLRKVLEAYSGVDVSDIEPFPDVIPTLIKLRELGIRTAFVTGGFGELQKRKIKKLGLTACVDRIYYVDYGRPKKDAFIQFSSDFGIACSDMMVVGDRISYEILDGNKLGAVTVRMRYGKYANRLPSNRFEEPTYTIGNFSEILGLIDEINKL